MTKLRKDIIISFVIALLFAVIFGTVFSTSSIASAADIESIENYTFNLVTDSDGNQSYSVAVKAVVKPGLKYAIIPEKYNGLSVTEIANNGFMSCTNLQTVILPTSVKKIGNNAFMNNSKLERVTLAHVENIGMNAFAMCPNLNRLFIPSSVKSVGANILRNNKNKVYIQSSAESVASEWQSTWNSYFTGETVYNANSSDILSYREILDKNGENVVGYEIPEYQFFADETEDIVIYNAVRTDENSPYYPLLNICSEAFTFSQANSLTIKDIRELDETAPEFDHAINLRSNAFFAFLANSINIETKITLDHPTDFQTDVTESMFDQSEIKGDLNGNSTKVFAELPTNTITLKYNLNFIAEKMFYNCPYLETLNLIDEDNNIHTNILHNIKSIGAEAFSSCGSLSNFTIPSSVEKVGESVFFAWGTGYSAQTLNVDFYQGFLPNEWSENWFGGDTEKTTINYKEPKYISIDLQN